MRAHQKPKTEANARLEAIGWPQWKIAERLGITGTCISQIVRAKGRSRRVELFCADLLNITHDEFLLLTRTPYREPATASASLT